MWDCLLVEGSTFGFGGGFFMAKTGFYSAYFWLYLSSSAPLPAIEGLSSSTSLIVPMSIVEAPSFFASSFYDLLRGGRALAFSSSSFFAFALASAAAAICCLWYAICSPIDIFASSSFVFGGGGPDGFSSSLGFSAAFLAAFQSFNFLWY